MKINDELVTSFPKEYRFDNSTKVRLEAIPDPGYRFFRWMGESVSQSNVMTVDVSCDMSAIAVFNPIVPVLTIDKHGLGSVAPYTGQNPYPPGTNIELKATPAKGWKFDGWTGAVDSPASAVTNLLLNKDTKVVANFSPYWPLWLLLGGIIGAMIIIGGITWFVLRHRKKVKNSVFQRKQVKNNILRPQKGKNNFLLLLRSSNTSFVFRLILGGIFIFTGFAKINHISALISEIKQYQILPVALASTYGHVLPYLEILVGVLLVLGIVLRISASIAGLMLISFAAAKIVAMIRGLNINVCNCFGPAVPLLSTQSLAIDIVMLLLAIQIILFRKELFSIPGWMRRRNTPGKD